MRAHSIKSFASVTGIALLSGFIILFPFFGTKAQRIKKEDRKEMRGSDTPRHKTIIIRDGDLDKALTGINSVNLDSIELTVQKASANVDFDAIGKNIEESMKSIHADSIRLQVEAAMKNVEKIDFQKMQVDMQKAMAESQKAMVEMQKGEWQKEFQKGMKEMQQSLKEMKIQLPDLKKEMEAARKEVALAKLNMKDDLAKAKVDIERSKVELAELKTALAEMKKDGLVKEGETVKLEWKNGRLFINGKEQSQAVSDKYRKLENTSFQNSLDEEDD